MRLTRASFFTRTVAIFLGAFASTSGCNQIIGLEVGDLDTGTTSSTTATGDTTTSPTTTVGPTTGSNGGMGGSGGDGIGGQGGQGGETPPPIPTDELVFWFDATQGLTENGGAVSQWNDLSGNDYHATQPTGLWQPTIGSIAGVQALTFDGDNDQLDLPTISANYSNGVSVFAVFANSDTAAQCPPIFQLSNGAEMDDVDLHTEPTQLFYEVASEYAPAPTTFETGVPMMASLVHVSNQVEVRANGASIGLFNMTQPSNTPRAQNFIGYGLYAGCGRWQGAIGEIILYSRQLLAGDRDQVEQYLQNKWGCCQ